MAWKIEAWKCEECKKIYELLDDAWECEREHSEIGKFRDELKVLLKKFFPVQAILFPTAAQWKHVDEFLSEKEKAVWYVNPPTKAVTFESFDLGTIEYWGKPGDSDDAKVWSVGLILWIEKESGTMTMSHDWRYSKKEIFERIEEVFNNGDWVNGHCQIKKTE